MKPSHLAAVVLITALAGLGYSGMTASNTIPTTAMGSGSATVSGYTITNIAYNHPTTNPANVDSVTFTVAPATASYVKIRLTAAGAWYSCTNTSGSVSCPTASPQATSADPDSLTIVASN